METSVVIIGGGLGGLFTGALLAKEGGRVTVIEKNANCGGGLQSFRRFGEVFDTGMHVFGGMRDGGNIRRICDYLGISDKIHLRDVDSNSSDVVHIAEDGTKKTPVMIHRACFGSLERFIGIMIENYAGVFPTWLAPVQVKIIPVNLDYHKEYCEKLANIFSKEQIRFECDYREEKLGYKIRESQTKKIPYTLVIGDNEVQNNLVTYRKHGTKDQITVSVEEFVSLIKKHVEELN